MINFQRMKTKLISVVKKKEKSEFKKNMILIFSINILFYFSYSI